MLNPDFENEWRINQIWNRHYVLYACFLYNFVADVSWVLMAYESDSPLWYNIFVFTLNGVMLLCPVLMTFRKSSDFYTKKYD